MQVCRFKSSLSVLVSGRLARAIITRRQVIDINRGLIAPPSISRSKVYGYSQGILVEGGKEILFISGQVAMNKKGEFVGGTFREQYKMALYRVEAVLKEEGATKGDIVKITTFVTEMKRSIEEFDEMNRGFFSEGYPTSMLVEVAGLAFPNQVVEIEAIAVV